MISLIILLAGFVFFIFSVVRLFQKKIKVSIAMFASAVLCLLASILFSNLGRSVLHIASLKNQISGNGMDGLEEYKLQLNTKCKSIILDQCSQASQQIESIQLCMFSKYSELSDSCQMFLANTLLKYPPLTEDKVVAGISFPKGSVLYMSKGLVHVAEIPVSWKFSGKLCGKGQVMFSHWEIRPEDKIKISNCSSE